MQFVLIGLGNMGMALGKHALRDRLDVVAYNRSREKTDELVAWRDKQDDTHGTLTSAATLADAVGKLPKPRIVWNMVSAGKPTEAVLLGDDGLIHLLERGDIVIDGVNSHFRDSQRRAAAFAEKGVVMLDVGTSGGVEGALNGACFMIGGDKAAFEHTEEIFAKLATEGGYGYFGKSGAGHYVKIVHNSIEYGVLQSLGEGFELLRAGDFAIDLTLAARVFNNGSIIESRLMGWLQQALASDKDLAQTSAEIGSLGTGKWAVEEALDRGVPYTANTHAVYTRYRSRFAKSFQAKVVQALRSIFGAHSPDERDASKLG